MNTIPTDQLLGQLKWRYATKAFDATKKIAPETWTALEDALQLTPSSYGLQPWKFIVISDQATKDSLVEASWGQKQVADCSHLVVIAAKTKITEGDVDHFIDVIEEVQGRSKESLEGYKKVIVGDLVEGERSKTIQNWSKNQCYIALGNLLNSCALLGVDACPMEGFKPAEYDQILGLTEKGLTAAVLCTTGYRSADDKYAELPKVRYCKDEVFERI